MDKKKIKQEHYYLNKQTEVSKEEYKIYLQDRIKRYRVDIHLELDMKISKYKARIEKERLQYAKLAESFEKKLKELQ